MVLNNLEAQPEHTALENLSSVEILTGLLVYARELKFPEQALYKLFREISQHEPNLSRRFRVVGNGIGQLRSEPLRRILDHLEMGKIIEVPQPNPVDQFYTLRNSQSKAVEEDLKERGVIPAYEKPLRALSERFAAIAQEATRATNDTKESDE
jgi:hypothetical protein